MPLFSIVTINYNNISGFINTKKSLEEQVCQNFEWIVIDGGSSDGFLDLSSSIKMKNYMAISEKDKGIYDAMNKGAKIAKGEYFLFLNSGDLLYNSTTLLEIEEYLNKFNTAPDVIFGSSLYKLRNGLFFVRKTYPIAEYLWHGLPANQQSTYYHKSLFTENCYDLKYEICGDYFLLASMYSKNHLKCTYFPQPISIFEVNGKSFGFKKKLFLEPYFIQRDILKSNLCVRILSLIKRVISTGLIIILSSNVNSYIKHYINRINDHRMIG